MQRRLPPAAIILGIAGLIPFIGLGLASVSTRNPVDAQRYLLGLVGFGAVILAFLGGIHWGFVLHPSALPEGLAPDSRRDAARLGLGVLPSLIGWAALLTPAFGIPEVGLGVLIAGFVAVLVTEARGRTPLPGGYLAMRWGLSIVVLAVLVTVLVLRLIGATLAFL
jgi:hypothetical protein